LTKDNCFRRSLLSSPQCIKHNENPVADEQKNENEEWDDITLKDESKVFLASAKLKTCDFYSSIVFERE
jgi:hypothetical protein